MGERMKSVGRDAAAGDEVAMGQLVAGAVRKALDGGTHLVLGGTVVVLIGTLGLLRRLSRGLRGGGRRGGALHDTVLGEFLLEVPVER